jgi:hypothetical protein
VVSFTRVIARTPALNWVDMLGRRPAAVAVPGLAAGPEPAAGAGPAGRAVPAGDPAAPAAAAPK